ncbi:MAG: TonB-dependent receptor [Prevotellaceae bacterium]|jgi:hypothetical protein|nr:TonB-dependent receptor [Prevotellaceae bacterium]
MSTFIYAGWQRKTGCLLCTLLLAVAAYAAPDYTLHLRHATLDAFVRKVEQLTGYTFIYGEEVRLAHPITVEAVNQSLAEILRRAFTGQSVGYEITGRHILLTRQSEQPRQGTRRITLSGYVTDSLSSETLIGANLYERLHRTGTSTNSFGFYTLTLPEGEVDLTISYLGYQTRSVRFTAICDTVLSIPLIAANQLDEVLILADKKETGVAAVGMGSHEIPLTQIRNTPSILGEADPLKTIQLLPGVQAGVEGFSGIYVRGGSPDQNLIMLDGIPVYNADHLLGIFSIFTPEAIKKATFFKGSFPARYGGRLSSIVDVRTNDGDMKHYHGTVTVGTLTDKLHFEGPIVKDRTSFILTARTTHTLLLSPFLKVDGTRFNYFFYDLNAKINHRFGDRSRLFLAFYHGSDNSLVDSQSDETVQYYPLPSDDPSEPEWMLPETDNSYHTYSRQRYRLKWGNTILSARWNYVFSNKLFSNTTVAFNSYRMLLDNRMEEQRTRAIESSVQQYGAEYRSGIRDWSVRFDFDYTPLPAHRMKFGAEYLFHTFRPETMTMRTYQSEAGAVLQDTLYNGIHNSNSRGHELSIYAEDDIDLGRRISANLGAHLSLFHTQGKSYLSLQPRLSARYRFDGGFSVKASFTNMAQYVHLLTSSPVSMPTDLWVPITRNIRPMYANQWAVGGYYTALPGWEFSIEGYYKQMRNVLEYREGSSYFSGTSNNWENKVEMGNGRSMGVEWMVQKSTGKTTGWLSYTLSKSDRQFKNGTINHGWRFPYKYDRRHSVSLLVNHAFSQRFEIGASWMFNSGAVITVPDGQTVTLTPDGHVQQIDLITRRNNYRLPATHRLNLSVNFHKKTRHGMRTWNISLYNAYNAMNPTFAYLDRDETGLNFTHEVAPGEFTDIITHTGRTKLKKDTLLPIFPSVTYTYKF